MDGRILERKKQRSIDGRVAPRFFILGTQFRSSIECSNDHIIRRGRSYPGRLIDASPCLSLSRLVLQYGRYQQQRFRDIYRS